jgi:hypothetical protein
MLGNCFTIAFRGRSRLFGMRRREFIASREFRLRADEVIE